MQTSVNQRVDEVRKQNGLSMNAFAKAIGVSQPTISKIISRHSEPQYSTLVSIIQTFGISPEWLMTGLGNMISSENHMLEPSAAYAFKQYNTVEQVQEQDWQFVKKSVQENQAIKIFRVIGDSMAPTLHEGDFVFCYPHDKLRDEIRNTHIYVIDSIHHGLLIKRIVAKTDGYVTLYADNKSQSKSFRLRFDSEVLSLYRVRTRMTWQLGAPSTEADYFAALAERIANLEKKLI